MKKRLMLVDDYVEVHETFERMIRLHGSWLVCGTVTGQSEALEAIIKERPDCVLVDLKLAEGDGISLIEEIRDLEDPQPRVIVRSGRSEREYRRLALMAGADQYICKAASNQQLLDTIRTVLSDDFVRPVHSLKLSFRERSVLLLIHQKKTEISDVLKVKPSTVDSYIERLKSKLGVESLDDLRRLMKELAPADPTIPLIGFGKDS
ncbi:MAG: hypothetical protein AUK47_19395 [Deltaproteobacteria bacterium CG2_30_63_29]|nr:MAG: hypothetical protein AUK47_19395 [Deltaproteobacteria bacterium CG2_30_63_29]